MVNRLFEYIELHNVNRNTLSCFWSTIKAIGSLIVILLLNSFLVYGQTNNYTGASGGNWNTAGNWSLGVPTESHNVVIPDNRNVTVNTAAVCNSLTINGGANVNTITISAGNSLTVTNDISIGAGTGNGDDKFIAVGANTLTCRSIIIDATGNNNINSGITVSTGTVNVNGNISFGDANCEFNFTGAGILNISGSMTGGTFTRSTSTVNYNGITGTQLVGGYAYYNVNFSGAAIKQLTANISVRIATVAANSNLYTEAYTITEAVNPSTFTLNAGSTLGIGHAQGITTAGNATGNIRLDTRTFPTTANYYYNGTAGQVTGNALPATVNDFTSNNSNAAGVTLSQALTINGVLDCQQGPLVLNGNTLTLAGTATRNGAGTGTITGSATSDITINGSGDLGTLYFTAATQVRTFTLNRGSNGIVGLGSNLSLAGNLVNTQGILDIGSNTLTLNLNTAGCGAGTGIVVGSPTSTVSVINAGTLAINIPSMTIGNLTINKTNTNGVNMCGNVIVNGTLTLTAGNFNIGANTLTLNGPAIAGTPANLIESGTSSMIFGGNSSGISIPNSITALTNLTIGNTSGVSLNGALAISGVLTLEAGLFSIGSNNLTLATSASIGGTPSSSAMIVADGTGQLIRTIAAGAGSYLYPIGDNTSGADYSPVTLSFTANSLGTRTVGARVTDAVHPQYQSNGVQTDFLSRYWSFTDGSAGTYTYTATFTYVSDDINGVEGNIKVNRYNASWYPMISSASSNSMNIVTGQTQAVTSGLLNGSAFTGRVEPSVTYTWNQTGSANFQTAANWTPNRTTPQITDILQFNNGAAGTVCTNVPTQTVNRIIVSANTNVSLQAAAAGNVLTISGGSGDNLDIQSGSTLQLSGANALTINYLPATQNVSISGNLNIAAGHTYDATNSNTVVTGTITSAGSITSAAANLNFNSGATYNHNYTTTAGTIPTATWDNNSTLAFIGYTTNANVPSGLGQSFGNFLWNCTAQTANIDLNAQLTTVNGNFTMQSSNTGSLRLTSATTLNSLSIGGDLNITGGTLSLTNGANNATVNVAGDFSMSGTPTLNLQSAAVAGVGVINLDGNFTMGGGTINEAGTANTHAINFSGTATQTFTKSGGTISNRINFYVLTGAILDMGTSVLDGTNAWFYLNSGATLVTAHLQGISSTPATGCIQVGGTRTFDAAANYNFNGAAAQVTGNSFTAANNVTINNASGVTLTSSAAISGTLTLNQPFNVNSSTLSLNGPAIAGTATNLVTTTNSSLSFGGSAAGITIPSSVLLLNNLTINNANGITLNSNITLNNAGILTLTSGNLILGDYNITVNTAVAGAPFNSNKMIMTNGSGSFIRTGAAVADFQTTYPVGTNGYYSPMVMSTLAATTGSGSVSVRAVASRQSFVDIKNDALVKYWVVSTTGLAGITDARVTFDYNAGEVVGNSALYVPRIWNGTAFVVPGGATSAGADPFGTNAAGNTVLAGEWTAIDPTTRISFYSYQNGNWNDFNSWTLDPSGALYTNPSNLSPTSADKVQINTGHIITMPVGLNNQGASALLIEGTLDLAATTGHTFSYLSGSGRIRISNADVFPTTTTNTLFTTDEGTVEYYGTSFSLTTSRNIYHLEVNMNVGQTLTLMATPYNVGGNLTIKQGYFRINDGASTVQKILTVQKDITVNSGAYFTVGGGNTLNGTIDENATGSMQFYLAYHSVNCYGNFTNNGTVRFTNRNNPDYNTMDNAGAVSLFMKGATDNTFTCNNTTDLNYLIIDKGSDQSYKLTLYASDEANFRIFGCNHLAPSTGGAMGFTTENPELRKALWIRNGTLEVTGYTFIPSLTEPPAGGWGDYQIPSNGALWINGANVRVWSTIYLTNPTIGGAQAAAGDYNATNGDGSSTGVFGLLRVSNGYFTTGSHGLYLSSCANCFGQILIENNAVLDIPGIRTGNGDPNVKYSFTQTGGTLRLLGDNGYEYMADYASLCMLGSLSTFTMSGGTIEIYDGQNYVGGTTGGIIRIEVPASNVDVTGGTVRVIRNNAGSNNFGIYTTAPFYNLELTGAAATNLTVSMNTAVSVLNNLTINDYSTLDATTANNNLSIGGNFTLGNTTTTNNAVYNARSNTTTFNGNQNSTIIVTNTQNATPLTFYNLTLDKTPTSSLATAWSVTQTSPGRNETAGAALNHLTTITNDILINEGKWNNYRFKTRAQRHITNYGTILSDATNPGRITLETGGTQHQLTGSTSTTNSFGNIELNNANGAQLYSNISTDNFYLTAGIMNINTYNLAVSGSISGSAFGTTKMIQSYGSASSQGVTISMSLSGAQGSSIVVPIGVAGTLGGWGTVAGAKYTPLTINLSGDAGAGPFSGTVNIRAVDEYHPTSDPNKLSDLIPLYWKTIVTGSLPNVPAAVTEYSFYSSYDFGFGGGKKECYYRNADWTEADAAANPLVFTATGLSTTDYTAGKRLAFRNPQYLYSRQSGNWNSLSTWSTVGHGVTSAPTVLNSFDVYEIGGFGSTNHQVTVTASNTVASRVIIQSKGITGITTDPAPSLIVNSGLTGNDFNLVSGGGRIVLNDGTFPGGDYLDFAYNDTAIFEYSGGSYTIPSASPAITIYPNLHITGTASSVKTAPAADILVRKTLKIGDNTNNGVILRLNTTAAGNIIINDSLILDNQGRLEYQNAAQNRTVTVYKNVNCITGGSTETNYIGIQTAGGTFSTPTHKLIVQGDIRIGASTFNFWTTNAQKSIDLVLNGETDSRIYDYTGTLNLSRLEINKSAATLKATIDEAFSLGAVTNTATKPLYLQQGILRINNSSSSIVLSSGGGDFTIPTTGSLILDQGTLSVSGDNTGITLNGLLEINNGTISVYNAANTNNYIQYSSTGDARINVTGGLLRVGSHLRRYTTTTGGVLYYNQTGGTVELGYDDAPTTTRGVFEVMNNSTFILTGGTLTVFQGTSGNGVPSVYIDPASSNIGSSMTINFGGAAGSPNIGLYSSVPLPNINITSTGTPTVQMWTVPLTVNNNLTINSGATFNANGLQLNIKGNFINNGTFTHNNNTTVFNGAATQSITGATTFYHLTKQSNNTLNLNNAIQISGNLRIEAGTLADNGNNIKVLKDVYNVGTHTYGGSVASSTQLGIQLNGTIAQEIAGTGTFGKLTIDNANGVSLPIGSSILITNALRLNQGIFDIQGNLLALGVNCAIEGSGFNAFKMIQTNISFTDNGIKKTFASGAQTFTYPIGSMGKYTPLTFNITANANSTGSITLKAANEIHPSIIDDTETGCQLNDLENVLQYHWILRSSGISGFAGTAEFSSSLSDVSVNNSCLLTSADYITARLLMSSVTWNKFVTEKFNETTGVLEFDFNGTDDNGISGDYICGIDNAIPNTVTTYQTINSGNWTNTAIWETVPAGGPIPAGGPRGAYVIINPTHTVDVTVNRDLFSYRTDINGTLNLNSTTQHRLGYVFGTGTLKMVDMSTLPAGDYSGTNGFITSTGGTLEYAGTTNYSVLSNIPSFNNVTFSGSGNRELPNIDLLVHGNIAISGPTVVNSFDQNIEIRGNINMSAGKFTARVGGGNPQILFSGANAQSLTGNFTTANTSALYNLEINKSAGSLTMGSSIEVSNNLLLTNRNIITTSANLLTLLNPLSTAITGGSSSSFIDGPLRKKIDNLDNFTYPIGKGTRYGQVSALSAQSTVTNYYWTAEYFNSAYSDLTTSPVAFNVSNSEYWKINSPVDGYTSVVKLRWDAQSDITPLVTSGGYTDMRVAEYDGTDWIEKTSTNQTNDNYNGFVQTSTAISINSASHPQFYTLGSSSALKPRARFSGTQQVCSGVTNNISVTFTNGSPNYTFTYTIDGSGSYTPGTLPTSSNPFSFTGSTVGRYRLATFTANGVTGVVDTASIWVNSNPTASITVTETSGLANNDGTICSGAATTLTASGGTSYSWSTGSTSSILSLNPASTTTYTVTVTNSSGCSANTNQAITVNALPTASLSGTTTICDGQSTNLSATLTGSANWSITYTQNGLNPQTINNIASSPHSFSVNPSATTTYAITAVSDANACVGTSFGTSAIITVAPLPATGPVFRNPNN